MTEVFASKIRLDFKTEGLKVDREEFKLKSYADNEVLIILNTQLALKQVMEKINKFSFFFGYKINREKKSVHCLFLEMMTTSTDEFEENADYVTIRLQICCLRRQSLPDHSILYELTKGSRGDNVRMHYRCCSSQR